MDVSLTVQYEIRGTDRKGLQFPVEHGFADDECDLYARAIRYRRLFPTAVQIDIDMAFPMDEKNG